MTNIYNTKTLATAATTTKAPKGRHDLNHGCNPCAETTSARYRGKPCLLLILLALCAIATTARAQIIVYHDNVKYVLYNDGTAYVDYSPGAWGTLNLRETVSYNSLTCTVTRIADGAFYNNYQITGNLVIPNTVTHIGSDAFRGCSGLNGTLTLPDSLQTIGNEAFYQCTGLTGQLNLPATLTSIGSAAFSGCSGFDWSTLTLPPLLTEIGYDTFYGIQFTGDLVVPDGVTSIGVDAFNGNKFSSITIGNGVTTIGHRAFRLTAADQLTLGCSVASIGDEAFRYYDDQADHIINVECLNPVPATLGDNVFQYHSKWLVTVSCGARDAYMHSFGWPQGGAVSNPLGFNITETRIKVAKPMLGNFTGYVYYLLNPCDGTATVTHSGYTEADENNNSYLQSQVVIPSTVEHEGEIYRVTKIGARAFKGCSLVSSVYIGDYVESIGNYAFYGVKDLVYFTCHNPVPPALGVDVFYSSNPPYGHLYQLTVPCGSVEAYQNAWQWNSFKNFQSLNYRAKVEINGVYYVLNCDGTATVTHAGYSEDDSNSGSYSGYVVIPGTVTYKGETHVVNRIGNNAFKGCVSLTDAIIGENVETIGDNAFEGCTALTRGGSGGDLANIGNNAFKGCTALTSVTIGENVENIGNNAFDGCTALSVISSQRPEPPALGSNVFSGVPTTAVLNVPCTATEAYAAAAQWQDFNIQGTVLAYINAQIDGVYYVLNPCRGTATVTHAGYDEIANAHYMNSYSGVETITIPATVTHEGATYDVTRIGNYAFLFSNSLTSIVIGEKVGYVGGDAFGGCSGLQSITSKNPTPPTLGWSGDVFQQVPTTAVLYVPCSAVETYAATGGWNRFETIDCEKVGITATANPSEGGTITGAGDYEEGASCTLTATANTGYTFVNWTKGGTEVSTNATYTFTVTESAAYVAHFELNSYAVTATANPTAGGTVTGAGTYNHGASCTLTATANTGYTFVNWTKGGTEVSTNATYTFTVTESAAYVAHFELNSYAVSATANPTAGGTVTGAGTYNHGASCTLTATANTGYTFVNWTKDGTEVSTNATYTFTVTEAAAYVAHFELNSYAVTATANPTAGGTITGAGTYNHGASCTLTATANTGYTFVNWTKDGAEVSTNATYTFTVTEAAAYVAHFELNSYAVSATANPTAGGTVTGAGTYNHGASCTLTATASTGYTFVNWTKDGTEVSTNATYTFTVTEAAAYVAHFELNSYAVTATANPTAGGTVTGAGTYNHGASCTLTATANTGYTFVNWTKDGTEVSTNATYTFTVTESAAYVAHFEVQAPTAYTITAIVNPAAGGTVSGAGTYSYGETCTLTVTLNTNYEFVSWTLDGAVISEDETYSFVVTEDRHYTANLRYVNGVGENPLITTEVYPNPAMNTVTITSTAPVELMEIYSYTGALIYRATPGADKTTVDVSEWASGTYTIRLVTSQGFASSKFVKTK